MALGRRELAGAPWRGSRGEESGLGAFCLYSASHGMATTERLVIWRRGQRAQVQEGICFGAEGDGCASAKVKSTNLQYKREGSLEYSQIIRFYC